MTLAIEYPHIPSVTGDVLGINVAVDDFLKAWFRYSVQEKFICRPLPASAYDHFVELAKTSGLDPKTRCIGLEPRTPQQNLGSINCLFRPDPAISDMVWRRQQLQGHGYAACGLVHSLSGDQVARAVTELCLAPTDASDALICPSVAIRDAVRRMWDGYVDYLNKRFGGAFLCPVQTPVIPIGIDAGKFAALASPDKRKSQRQALNVANDEIVILFVGRLSFATKAHPLPLLLAAEQAAKNTKRKLRLVLYGYFKPQDMMEPRFRALASDIAQTVRCDIITNDDPRFPDGLWAGADIFTSLVDNVQESFGLTPIEAMACGLPAVVSNWDGYRDGVRDGEDGFLIPTTAPPAIAGHDIAAHYFNENNYGSYLVSAAQSTAIDIAVAARAFVKLADDDELRRQMGQNGLARAQNVYDWSKIIPAYEELWKELAERRRAQEQTSVSAAHPAFPNPFDLFQGFPRDILKLEDRLRVVMTSAEITLILKHDMNFFIPELLLPAEALQTLIEGIRNAGSIRVMDILAGAAPQEQLRLWRCLGWMLKHGVCVREGM
jgi:glycosyltransferase involved in cell wall biosynthesis